LNKLLGLYVERLEVKHDDPMAILLELATISPQLAAQAARHHGLDWPPSEQVKLIAPNRAQNDTYSAE
jgi:hypothetical protein